MSKYKIGDTVIRVRYDNGVTGAKVGQVATVVAPQPSTPALQWTTIVGEKSRTYRYANGETFTVERVSRVAVRPTNHRLETADGKKFIVRGGYVAIELDTEVWSA